MLLEYQLGHTDLDESGSVAETKDKLVNGQYTHLILDISFGDSSGIELLPWI